MLVGSDTRRVNIPHEPDEWIEIRTAIAPYHLERAREQFQIQVARHAAELGETVVRSLQKSAQKEKREAPSGRAALDMDVLTAHAVTAWSYDAPVVLDNIRRLDAETRDWLHDQVWDVARPPTEAEVAANLGESSPPSTGTDTPRDP